MKSDKNIEEVTNKAKGTQAEEDWLIAYYRPWQILKRKSDKGDDGYSARHLQEYYEEVNLMLATLI